MKNQKTAILIVNLGSPKAPTASALKPYLRQFLSDPRIVESENFFQKILWQTILNLIILQKRPRNSAKKYQSVWMNKESPLLFYTKAIFNKIREKSKCYVDFAMRYGTPSIPYKLAELQRNGFHKILIVPLFAQYSATTIGSIMDEVARYLLLVRQQPKIRAVQGWFDDAGYIESLIQTIESQKDCPKDILVSFHGIPKKYADAGDPYRAQCGATFQLLSERLPQKRFHLAFQSCFGPAEWLEPYAIDCFENFPKKGIHNLAVICPGFCTDCLETLEEIEIAGKKVFLENGGKNFVYLKALNDGDFWMENLWRIIQKELAGF